MRKCIVIVKDEVNCKLEGLELPDRKTLMKKFEFEKPGARFLPSVRLGRWNGKVSYFSLGGSTYINLLPDILPVVEQLGYDIELQDLRQYKTSFQFNRVDENTFSNHTWPKGHVKEGDPIVLRDYQVEVINAFLSNPQSLQEVATGAGKCLSGETLLSLDIDENSSFGKFVLNKLRQEQVSDVTKNNNNL